MTTGKYAWLNAASQVFLERDYLLEGQTLDERVDQICAAAKKYLGDAFDAEKFKSYFEKGWYSMSSPVWANFGTDRGLPISCFSSHVEDSMESILFTQAEVGMMSKQGGGTSGYFGDLRGRGAPIRNNGSSSGSVHFMTMFDHLVGVVSQGKTRRGNFAAYLPIDHPDIHEFLKIRSEGNQIQDMSFGVCVPDAWLEAMIAGDAEKRAVWARVLQSRANTGYPYIFFTDNVNKGKPEVYADLPINGSNLCVEIALPASADESFVCCLSSMNLLYFDDWKDTDAVELLVMFLDAVMEEFIQKAKSIRFMERAVRFAERHRALGMGVLGYHSYLQSKMIPFESFEAKMANVTIFKTLKEQAYAASEKMYELFGAPPLLAEKGVKRRNATLMAVAPTKSSSFILGQASEGIEPHRSNYYIKDAAKGKFTIRNPHLEALLKSKGKDTPEVWEIILKRAGSVQHLDFLDEHEKGVFKTFGEISPKEIVIQASARQKFIDQSQSLNLMIHPSIPVKDVNALVIEAWRMGVKSLYYQISVNAAQEFSRNILQCKSCEG